jgi:hypothetical protein
MKWLKNFNPNSFSITSISPCQQPPTPHKHNQKQPITITPSRLGYTNLENQRKTSQIAPSLLLPPQDAIFNILFSLIIGVIFHG